MKLAAFIFIWCLALFTILVLSENRPQNGGVPLVKSSAAQTDLAKQNTWLTPCPVTPQNIPHIREVEQV